MSRDRRLQPKRARGRLIVQHPPPRGWRPGWTTANLVRRCGCGAPVVTRSVRYSRCERGCTRLAVVSRPHRPPPPAPPPPAEFTRLLDLVRGLERGLLQDTLKCRRPSAHVIGLALKAAEALAAAYPDHASEAWSALSWLARKRAELARLAGRAA